MVRRKSHQVKIPEPSTFPSAADFFCLGEYDLHDIADQMRDATSPDLVEFCARFVVADTKRNGHGRIRALLCRRLKHVTVTPEQSSLLVECILDRFVRGDFGEQFRDQLRLALHLDRTARLSAGTAMLESPKQYLRRHATWMQSQYPP